MKSQCLTETKAKAATRDLTFIEGPVPVGKDAGQDELSESRDKLHGPEKSKEVHGERRFPFTLSSLAKLQLIIGTSHGGEGNQQFNSNTNTNENANTINYNL